CNVQRLEQAVVHRQLELLKALGLHVPDCALAIAAAHQRALERRRRCIGLLRNSFDQFHQLPQLRAPITFNSRDTSEFEESLSVVAGPTSRRRARSRTHWARGELGAPCHKSCALSCTRSSTFSSRGIR